MKPGPLRLIHGFTRALVLIKPLSSPIARVGLPPLYDCSRDHVHSALGNFTPKCPAAAQSARPFHPRNPSANSAYTHPEEGQSDVIHPDEDCPDEEYLEELYAGAEEKGEEHPYDDQDDIMAGSNASSGDKKRKRGAPGFFAVKKGRKPGIYYSWADTFEQVNGFSGAVRTCLPSICHGRRD